MILAELNAVADYLDSYDKHLKMDREMAARLRAVAAQIAEREANLIRYQGELAGRIAELLSEKRKRERAIAEAVRERVLAEFAVPVEFRPTGWREKEPALRQRSADETRAAIRALSLSPILADFK
jgi:hypothetical protein